MSEEIKAPLAVSVNLRAHQPNGRFYMSLQEALDLYNGGLAEAILNRVEELEEELEREKFSYNTRRYIVKKAREAVTKSNITTN
jgi:hypothetical protein